MSEHHDEFGRFAKGHAGIGGAPKSKFRARSKADYLQRLHDKMTLAQWDKILDKAIEQALAGDHKARAYLTLYAIGRPLQAVEISGPGGSPLSLGTILLAIREVTPDPMMQEQIADRLHQLVTARQQMALPSPDGESDDSSE